MTQDASDDIISIVFVETDADMAELADAPDLGSGGQPCRFKSCYPHNERERQVPLSFVMRITDTIVNLLSAIGIYNVIVNLDGKVG